METINKYEYTLYLFSSKLVTIALEIFEYSWDAQTNMNLWLYLLYMLLVLFNVKQLFKNTTLRSALCQDGYGWQGVWEHLDRHLSWLSPLMVLYFTPEEVLKPKNLKECFKKVCPDTGNARGIQLTALSWGLTYA